jgi:hypothetical protein
MITLASGPVTRSPVRVTYRLWIRTPPTIVIVTPTSTSSSPHPPEVTLFDLARLERTLSELLGSRVKVVPAGHLRPTVRDEVLAEAVPL